MILMIDNYDSFTYNLVQYLGQLGEEVAVRRNDEITLEEIEAMNPEAIFLSPGPCSPEEAGITVDVIRHFHRQRPDHGRLPGPPGHRLCLRRPGGPGRTGSCTARPPRSSTTAGRSSGPPQPLSGGALPLAHRGAGDPPRLPGGERRDGRGGDHGAPAPGLSRGGGPVPPGIDPDAERKRIIREISWTAHRQERRGVTHDQGSNCEGRPRGGPAGSGDDGRHDGDHGGRGDARPRSPPSSPPCG